MGAPKTVVYCGKCGNTLLLGTDGEPVPQPIKVPPCRLCRKNATMEGFSAGRATAIAELFVKEIE